MQRDFQTTETRLGHGCSNWQALEPERSRTSSSSFWTRQRNAVTTTSPKLKWWNKGKGGNMERHPPPSHRPGEGWLRESPAVQGHQGNGGRKTPASKCSQESSTGPDSSSPQGSTDKEKGQSFWANLCDWLYHLILTTALFYFASVQQCCMRKMKITCIPPSAWQDKGWPLYEPTAVNISSCQ